MLSSHDWTQVSSSTVNWSHHISEDLLWFPWATFPLCLWMLGAWPRILNILWQIPVLLTWRLQTETRYVAGPPHPQSLRYMESQYRWRWCICGEDGGETDRGRRINPAGIKEVRVLSPSVYSGNILSSPSHQGEVLLLFQLNQQKKKNLADFLWQQGNRREIVSDTNEEWLFTLIQFNSQTSASQCFYSEF